MKGTTLLKEVRDTTITQQHSNIPEDHHTRVVGKHLISFQTLTKNFFYMSQQSVLNLIYTYPPPINHIKTFKVH